MFLGLLYFVHIAVCIFLILVVLLQQGRGADLSVFGGGSTQTAFGARGATTLLHKLTVASFVLFILTTTSIAVIKNRPEGTVMRGAETERTLPASGTEEETPPVAPDEEAADDTPEETETP